MVDALERHPLIRLGLHYSGPLLEWLGSEKPAFLERVATLAERGQIELLGGGYHEPILASLPERDRIAQLTRMAAAIERLGGRRPEGAWLAERVWEPDLPTSIVDAGYRWTILDDAHFRAAAIDDGAIYGAYTTDDQGRLLTLFGTDRRLRYGVPFGRIPSTIAHLRRQATDDGERIAVMGDDGEKFGAWPETYDHCWGRDGWVERFFDTLETRSAEIPTVTPSAWLAEHDPIGRAYIPTSSYDEMGEWALPADEAARFVAVAHAAALADDPAARWLRGGFWRNFAARYREVNDLHKQMLRVSDKVAAMPAGRARNAAGDHLGQGQSNDCYWHGIFGGIYLPHLRLATLGHLIAAEDIADRKARRTGRIVDGITLVDTDLDGRDEILATMPGQVVVIDPAEGAGIGSWDIRAARHGLASVLRRRPEAYHARLREADTPARPDVGKATTIHGVVRVREPGLADRLFYDAYERRSGLVHLLTRGTTHEAFATGVADEMGDAHVGRYEVGAITDDSVSLVRLVSLSSAAGPTVVRIAKRFSIGRARRAPDLALEARVEHVSGPGARFDLALEWAINLLGGRNPDAYYRIGEDVVAHDSVGERADLAEIAAGNRAVGIEVTTAITPAATVWWAPIETISDSEEGFEANCQGSALVAVWPTNLERGGVRVVTMKNHVVTAVDRPAEERP